MNAVEVSQLTYRYGRRVALDNLEFTVPEGSIYALLGPNGSGKTTLLQILTGLRRPQSGTASLMGIEREALTVGDRARIGYVAEGQPLPRWMRLEQLEAYLAPLYPTWDKALANDLRERFSLEPGRAIKTLSRGEHMKAALLCALAPRPQLLLMDEPFTGVDVKVKDDLVRGLLESSGSEGWSVLICSHDLGELELLADHVGILDAGRMKLSASMDAVRDQFRRVEVTFDESTDLTTLPIDPRWFALECAGQRASFVVDDADGELETRLRARLPGVAHFTIRPVSLRELFLARVVKSAPASAEVAA